MRNLEFSVNSMVPHTRDSSFHPNNSIFLPFLQVVRLFLCFSYFLLKEYINFSCFSVYSDLFDFSNCLKLSAPYSEKTKITLRLNKSSYILRKIIIIQIGFDFKNPGII